MKIHKATGTNVTLCSMPTRGKFMSSNWHTVDCLKCRVIGKQQPITEMKTTHNTQPELMLQEDPADV